MELDELVETYNVMLDDAATIVHNQQVLAGINVELDRNSLAPFEQDIIYQDHFGSLPSEPRFTNHNGVTISSRVLHQTGTRLTDVQGADLMYEIENEKFTLIQYKRPSDNRVRSDSDQLARLLSNCPDMCPNKSERPIPKHWLPMRMIGLCGCWYAVTNSDRFYVHACEAEAIFEGKGSVDFEQFRNGISKSTFVDLFAKCRIGALVRTRPTEADLQPTDYADELLRQNHFILWITQFAKWLV